MFTHVYLKNIVINVVHIKSKIIYFYTENNYFVFINYQSVKFLFYNHWNLFRLLIILLWPGVILNVGYLDPNTQQ